MGLNLKKPELEQSSSKVDSIKESDRRDSPDSDNQQRERQVPIQPYFTIGSEIP